MWIPQIPLLIVITQDNARPKTLFRHEHFIKDTKVTRLSRYFQSLVSIVTEHDALELVLR